MTKRKVYGSIKLIVEKYGLRYYRDFRILYAKISKDGDFSELYSMIPKIPKLLSRDDIKLVKFIKRLKRIPKTIIYAADKFIGQYRMIQYNKGINVYIEPEIQKAVVSMLIYEVISEPIEGSKIKRTIPMFLAIVPCRIYYES